METDVALPLPPSSLRDWRGVEYSKGSRVYYPISRKSSAYMVEAEVTEIMWQPVDVRAYETWGRKTPPRVVVKVRVIRDNTKGKRSRQWAHVGPEGITVA